jgi:hypothetical protein
MGLIYLLTFLFLIIKFKKKFFLDKKILFLLFFFFFTYALPIIFGFIFYPIIGARYLIFIIVPIIILISFLVFELNDNLKKIFIFVLFFSTLLNVYDDVFERNISKPDLSSVFKKINTSETKNIVYKLPLKGSNSQIYPALKNFTKKNNSNFKVVDQNDIDKETSKEKLFWYVCLYSINAKDCTIPKNKKIVILKELHFNSVDFKLLKIN